ncbi:hypothetical protein HOD38_05275 [archaeon]|jgi:hypothetical protein|nr:hypothetical protein [archaeon]MBT4397651.1 hypothetical protein [archaeon]MBT4441653.1 hypothetical protein [archaeon]
MVEETLNQAIKLIQEDKFTEASELLMQFTGGIGVANLEGEKNQFQELMNVSDLFLRSLNGIKERIAAGKTPEPSEKEWFIKTLTQANKYQKRIKKLATLLSEELKK